MTMLPTYKEHLEGKELGNLYVEGVCQEGLVARVGYDMVTGLGGTKFWIPLQPIPKEGEEGAEEATDCVACGGSLDSSLEDVFHAFTDVGFQPGDLQNKIEKLKKRFRFVKKG